MVKDCIKAGGRRVLKNILDIKFIKIFVISQNFNIFFEISIKNSRKLLIRYCKKVDLKSKMCPNLFFETMNEKFNEI